MGKRKYDSEGSSDGSDFECPNTDATPPQTKTSAKKAKTKAEVTIRATDTPVDKADAQSRVNNLDQAVLGRIRKALALASHPGTGEQEARAALRMAAKLLDAHNVTQADILAHETEAEQLKRAGQSVVSIKSTVSEDKLSYSTSFRGSRPKIDWTFYGLAEQTVAAAHAFEMTYNLILTWSLKPEVGKGINVRNCYCSGVAHGLSTMAEKEKELDKQRAGTKERALLKAREAEEAADDKSRLDRLKDPSTSESKVKEAKPVNDRRVKVEEVEDEDSLKPTSDDLGHHDYDDNDGPYVPVFETVGADFDGADEVDNLLDLDAELEKAQHQDRRAMPPPPPAVPIPKIEEEEDSPWHSVQQLVQFRESSIAIGDEYLKQEGIKLRKGRKRQPLEFKDSRAQDSYARGKKDARKIDVRQRQIKDVNAD
ncbi:hypothetical protein C8F01DRAFT_1103240 [Mycena amicta]|nr:hypothetical protein C8F01DRAFT_1103240 [Mycena amicta]